MRKCSRARLTCEWACLYAAGVLVAGIALLLRMFRRYQIFHLERFPKNPRAVLLVSNHPSYFVETMVLLPALFSRWYLFHPRYAAWNVPDINNFRILRRWFLSWILLRTIFMSRDSLRKAAEAVMRIGVVLRAGQSVIFFPEGGRTSSGNGSRLKSASGKVMRPLRSGIGRIVVKTGATVLPVWVDGTDKVFPRGARLPNLLKKMSVNVGDSIDFSALRGSHSPREKRKMEKEVEDRVTKVLLALADEPKVP